MNQEIDNPIGRQAGRQAGRDICTANSCNSGCCLVAY